MCPLHHVFVLFFLFQNEQVVSIVSYQNFSFVVYLFSLL